MKRDMRLTQGNGSLAAFPHIGMLCHEVFRKAGPLGQHRNPGIEICHVHKGRFDWTVEGRRVAVLPGTTSVTLPWEEHGGTRETMDVGELSWVIIRPDVVTRDGKLRLGQWSALPPNLQRYIGVQFRQATQPIQLARDRGSRERFCGLMDEFSERATGWEWRVNRLLDDLLLQLARSLERAIAELQRAAFEIDTIREAVRRDPARRWSLDDLCTLSGWSKSALNPRVKAETGYSTMEYVIVLRLELAQEWLKASDQSITDIALSLGFSSSQHFAMTFRQRLGMPPSAFRDAS
ncbi:MAG: AraC family transcriptional regulator [Verrucomicrobia bacterium]|nr:AraC family transcriptional regulator [Verrucomicrobiota bacterium]